MTTLIGIKELHFTSRFFAVAASGILAVGVALSPQHVAYAQDGAAGALLEEIVTTARKRSEAEAVQDVPIAVTAFGAAQIDALFVKKIDDLSYLMPNVQLEAVGTFPGVQNFSIRGQGINSSIPSVDPTVGVFVDGVYMGTTYGVVIDTFDLESVEVLRGPQGLLFGRNVTGGAVVLRNARPDGDPGVRIRLSATDKDQYGLAAAFEGSLVEDTLAGKIVVYYDDDSGYYDAPVVGRNVGEMQTTIIRPTLLWTPSDDTDVTFSFETGKSEGDGAIWTNVTAQRAGALDDFSSITNDAGYTDMSWDQAMVEVNVANYGSGTLTNIFGWRRVEADSATDIDGINLPIFFVPGNTSQKQISNELRWSGSVTENWDATIGTYYFEQDMTYREGRYIQVVLLRALGGDMSSENFGLFVNNDVHVNDTLTVSAGLRYTLESKDARIISGVGGGCADVVTFDCSFDTLNGHWDNITPKLGFRWAFADNSQLYGFWSKGYRSGGFNFRNAKPNIIPPGPTQEEENNTFEVGLKTDLMDGRMRLNIAAFQNKIDGMQRELNMPDADVVVLQATINAGDVTIKGIEVDFVALITDTFSVNLSYGWQDGEYDSLDPFVPAIEAQLRLAGVLGPTDVVIGNELPRLAPSNYSLGISWDIPLGEGLINFAANHSYRERHPYNDSNTEFFEDQERTNASINWFLPGDSWQVSLYGRNLGDEANWGNLTSIAGLYTAGPMKPGRTLGLEVNFRTD